MGNIDSIPVMSQMKSLVQVIAGDAAGALRTQESFLYNNTYPVFSQIGSAVYAAQGDFEGARNLQERFLQDMEAVIDSIPVVGHIKGGIHYAVGDNERGDEIMKSATRNLAVIGGGTAGGVRRWTCGSSDRWGNWCGINGQRDYRN